MKTNRQTFSSQIAIGIVAAGLLSSCMVTPTNDGVIDRWDYVNFKGLVFSPGIGVSIEAQRASDGEWQPIEWTQSGGTPYGPYHGSELYLWDVTTVVPEYAWEPGITGYTSRVRARQSEGSLFTFDMHFGEVVECFNGTSNWSEFVENCTSEESGVVTLKTPDYQPADVTVQVSSGGVVRHNSLHEFGTTRSENSSPFTHMAWSTSEVNRSNWFVDIFVEDHLDTHDTQFLRIPGQTSWQINLDAFYASLPRAGILPPRGDSFRSYRIYDQGACSEVLPWRDIFALATDDLESTLSAAAASDDDTGNQIRSLRFAAAQMTLTPIYSAGTAGSNDGFALYIPVSAQVEDPLLGTVQGVNFDLRVKIGLQAAGTTILTNLLSVEAENIAATSTIASVVEAIVPGFLEEELESQLPSFTAEIEAALPTITSPIALHRLHARPEGIEVVLAEVTTEPLAGILDGMGLCNRPSVTQSRIGFSGSLFEFPNTRPDPPIFTP